MFAAPVMAQETSEEPLYTHLEEGESAPFAGTLFNPTATAELITRHQYSMTECDLRVEYEIARCSAEMQLQHDMLQISYNSLSERHELLMDMKNDEIDIYKEMALSQPNKNNHWWLAGGVVAGIGVSLGVFYAATNIVQ